MQRRVFVFERFESDGIARVFVGDGRGFSVCRSQFGRPRSEVMTTAGRLVFESRAEPNRRAVFVDEDVRENAFAFVGEDFENFGIVLGVDVFDNSEDAAFDVDGAQLAVKDARVDDVVADDALTGDHSRRRFAARRRIGAREIRDAIVLAVDAHQKHVFSEPSFAVRSRDGESEGEFFEPDGISGVLVIDGEDAIFV